MNPRHNISLVLLLVAVAGGAQASSDSAAKVRNPDLIMRHRFVYTDDVDKDVAALRLKPSTLLAGVKVALGGEKGALVRLRVVNAPHYVSTARGALDFVPPVEVVKETAGPEVATLTFQEPVSIPHGWCFVVVERVVGKAALLTSNADCPLLCEGSQGDIYPRQLVVHGDKWTHAKSQYAVEALTAPADSDGSNSWTLDTVPTSTFNVVADRKRFTCNAVLQSKPGSVPMVLVNGSQYKINQNSLDTTIEGQHQDLLRIGSVVVPVSGEAPLFVELPLGDHIGRVYQRTGLKATALVSEFSIPRINRILSAAVADVNGDGLEDVIVISESESGKPDVFVVESGDDSGYDVHLQNAFQLITTPTSVNAGDLNDDGLVDLVWTVADRPALLVTFQSQIGGWKLDSINRDASISESLRPVFYPNHGMRPGLTAGYRRTIEVKDAAHIELCGQAVSVSQSSFLTRDAAQILPISVGQNSSRSLVIPGCTCQPTMVVNVDEGIASDMTGQCPIGKGLPVSEALVFTSASGSLGIITVGDSGIALNSQRANGSKPEILLYRNGPHNGAFVRYQVAGVWYSTIASQSFGGASQLTDASVAGIDTDEIDSLIVTWPGQPRKQELFTRTLDGFPSVIAFGTGRPYEQPSRLEISVVPNPVSDHARIVVKGPPDVSLTVRVTNTQGRVLFEQMCVTDATGQVEISFDPDDTEVSAAGSLIATASGQGMQASKSFVVIKN